MHVLSLVLGILCLAAFSWVAVIGGPAVTTLSPGGGWAVGVVFGVVFPALAILFGVLGRNRSKGMAIAGIVMGGIGVVIGLVALFLIYQMSQAMQVIDPGLDPVQGFNDPAMQQMMQQAGQAAPQ